MSSEDVNSVAQGRESPQQKAGVISGRAAGIKINLKGESNNVALISDSNADVENSEVQVNGSKKVNIELVSNAFQLDVPGQLESSCMSPEWSPLGEVRRRVSASLGILEEDLVFYSLAPLQGPDQAAAAIQQGGHLGVAVNRSGFSLSALEALLQERSHLTANLDHCTSALEGVREECSQHQESHASASKQLQEEKANSQVLVEQVHTLEAEVTMLRQQLARADELRAHSQKSLEELKGEFEILTKDIADDIFFNSNLKSTMESRDQVNATTKLPGNLGAPGVAFWSSMADPRAVTVLEKLCSEGTLSQLERIIDKLPSEALRENSPNDPRPSKNK